MSQSHAFSCKKMSHGRSEAMRFTRVDTVRADRYRSSARELLAHLDNALDEQVGYPDTPSWGYAFTVLAALEDSNDLCANTLAQKALGFYKKQDKRVKDFPWEFVTYALYNSFQLSGSSEIENLCRYRAKGTRMVNWCLLRQLNRLTLQKSVGVPFLMIRIIRMIYTSRSGQILDELKTRSFQYHAFCLFLLAELNETDASDLVAEWFVRGCRFALDYTLSDGIALYVGRGQEQIFGYGSLIYALEYAHVKYGLDINPGMEKISAHLLSFQRKDGSYPLVLNKGQPEKPGAIFLHDKPHGWYGYNTLYDYQPFLAYCLFKAAGLYNNG